MSSSIFHFFPQFYEKVQSVDFKKKKKIQISLSSIKTKEAIKFPINFFFSAENRLGTERVNPLSCMAHTGTYVTSKVYDKPHGTHLCNIGPQKLLS